MSIRDNTLAAVSPDMLAMMAYLRDIPLSNIGVHVAGRPDITGARLQAGIRFLFNRVPNTVAAVPAPVDAAKPVKAARGKATQPGTVAAFLAALQRVAKAGDARNSVPILATVRLSIRNGNCTLQCTDTERAITETFMLPSAADMDACIPFKPLIAALKAMPGHSVPTIEAIDPTTSNKSDAGVFKLGSSSFLRQFTTDYPDLNTHAGKFSHMFAMPAEVLCAALSTVQHAISTEETRYYLNGVAVQARDDSLVFITTDGHRLAKVKAMLPCGAEGLPNIIVPRLIVADIIALLGKATGNVVIEVGKMLRLTHGDTVILSKLVDGTFPEYDRVIPRDNEVTATLDKPDLIAGIKACMAVASKKSMPVRFVFERGSLTIHGADPEGGVTSQHVNHVGTPPKDFIAGYQGRYLLDLLASLKGNPVLHWADGHEGSSPCLIRDSADSDVLSVLMPVRV